MDDEEEDMSRPIPQLWQTPLRDVKFEDRATQIAASQALAAVTSAGATSQGRHDSVNTLPCSLRQQPHMPHNGKEGAKQWKQPEAMWAFDFRNPIC